MSSQLQHAPRHYPGGGECVSALIQCGMPLNQPRSPQWGAKVCGRAKASLPGWQNLAFRINMRVQRRPGPTAKRPSGGPRVPKASAPRRPLPHGAEVTFVTAAATPKHAVLARSGNRGPPISPVSVPCSVVQPHDKLHPHTVRTANIDKQLQGAARLWIATACLSVLATAAMAMTQSTCGFHCCKEGAITPPPQPAAVAAVVAVQRLPCSRKGR